MNITLAKLIVIILSSVYPALQPSTLLFHNVLNHDFGLYESPTENSYTVQDSALNKDQLHV